MNTSAGKGFDHFMKGLPPGKNAVFLSGRERRGQKGFAVNGRRGRKAQCLPPQ